MSIYKSKGLGSGINMCEVLTKIKQALNKWLKYIYSLKKTAIAKLVK